MAPHCQWKEAHRNRSLSPEPEAIAALKYPAAAFGVAPKRNRPPNEHLLCMCCEVLVSVLVI